MLALMFAIAFVLVVVITASSQATEQSAQYRIASPRPQ
jgi:hypothetical protein